MKKGLTYNDIYVCMALLGDALQLSLPKKALSEVLMLRAHYGRAQKDFEAAKKQIAEDAAQGKDAKKEKKAIEEAAKEAIEKKAAESAGIADRRLSPEAYTELCGAAIEAGTVRSGLWPQKNDKGEQEAGVVHALVWLEAVAFNLTE